MCGKDMGTCHQGCHTALSTSDNFLLAVEFDDGQKVLYDVKDDIDTLTTYRALQEIYGLFKQAQLDTSRTCVYWNDEIDLASDSIYEYGKMVRT